LQGYETRKLVESIRALGVKVHTPDSDEEIPAPGYLDVVVVTNTNMNRCVPDAALT
jgi:hypothetical protein